MKREDEMNAAADKILSNPLKIIPEGTVRAQHKAELCSMWLAADKSPQPMSFYCTECGEEDSLCYNTHAVLLIEENEILKKEQEYYKEMELRYNLLLEDTSAVNLKKLREELAEAKRFAFDANCMWERDAQLKKQSADKLTEDLSKANAMIYVLKDSQLRTYDGLAQRADGADRLLEALESAKLRLTGMEQYSVVYAAMDIINEAIKEYKNEETP